MATQEIFGDELARLYPPIQRGNLTELLNLIAGKQPSDPDLTAIAALATTEFGRSLLTQASAAAARTTLGAEPAQALGVDAHAEAVVASAYPTGMSRMRVTGWSVASGTVTTVRDGDARTHQTHQPNNSSIVRWRAWNATIPGWTAWARVLPRPDPEPATGDLLTWSVPLGTVVGLSPTTYAVRVLASNERAHGNLLAVYHSGLTVMPVTAGAWPGGVAGQVRTVKSGNTGVQTFTAERTRTAVGRDDQRRWTRQWNGTAWGPWLDDFQGPEDPDLCCGLPNPVTTAVVGPAVIDSHGPQDGWIYGVQTNPVRLRRKQNWADNWLWNAGEVEVTGADTIGGLFGCADGEKIYAAQNGLYRSSGWPVDPTTATWTKVLSPTQGDGTDPNAWFLSNGVTVRGGYAMACDVVRGVPNAEWGASRYFWLSQDDGQTWAVVRDTFGDNPEAHSHMTGIDDQCPWLPSGVRLWISWHDNADPGLTRLEYSDDLGQTWNIAARLHPMQMLLTPAGPVFSTDGPGERQSATPYGGDYLPNGIFIMDRRDPTQMRWLHENRVHDEGLGHSDGRGLVHVGRNGVEDRARGIAYFTFRTNYANSPPIIVATDGTYAAEVWRWSLTNDAANRIEQITVSANGELVAYLVPGVEASHHLVAGVLRWRPGRPFFRRSGADWVYAVGLPSGDVVDLAAPTP